ncbi:MAG: PEP-CTERM sorting domain-containing protein [Oceanipulchritudo sp.]
MKKLAILIPVLAAVVTTSGAGAISITASDLLNDLDGPTSGTLNFSQQASTDASFMVALYGRRLASANPTITYDVGGAGTVVGPSAFINFDANANGSGPDADTADLFAAIFLLDVGNVDTGAVDIGWNSGSSNTTMDVFQLSGAAGYSVLTSTDTTTAGVDDPLVFDLGSLPDTDSFALMVGVSFANTLGSGFAATGGTAPVIAGADQGGYTVFNLYDLGDATQAYGLSKPGSNVQMAGALLALEPVPEPSTYAIFAGFAALGVVIWRRRRMR